MIECESRFGFLWSKISDFCALFPLCFALLSCLCVVKESVFAWDADRIWDVPVRGWFNVGLVFHGVTIRPGSVLRFPDLKSFCSLLLFSLCVWKSSVLLCVDLPEMKGIIHCSCLLQDFGWSGVTWFLTSDQDRCEVCIVLSISLSCSVCCAPLVTPPRLVAVPICFPVLSIRSQHQARSLFLQ
jgi:hypothetical protein